MIKHVFACDLCGKEGFARGPYPPPMTRAWIPPNDWVTVEAQDENEEHETWVYCSWTCVATVATEKRQGEWGSNPQYRVPYEA